MKPNVQLITAAGMPRTFLTGKTPSERARIAADPKTAPEVLRQLAHDTDPFVRRIASEAIATPCEPIAA